MLRNQHFLFLALRQVLGSCKFRFVGLLFRNLWKPLCLHILTRIRFLMKKCLSFLKRRAAKNYVSYHAFDHPRDMYAGRKRRCNFLVSLSGRLTKLILYATGQKLAKLKQLPGRITFCSLRPRKRNTKDSKGVFLLRAHIPWIVRTLGRHHKIKIAVRLFLETRAFFQQKLWVSVYVSKVAQEII